MKQFLVCAVLGIGCFTYSTLAQSHPGSVDSTFQPQFELPEGSRVRDVVQDAEGRFIVASDETVRRLLEDGSIDPTFHSISITDGAIRAMDASPDGKIYVGGSFTRIDDILYPGVARLLENGNLDSTFQPEFVEPAANVYDIAAQSTGHVLAGGYFDVWAGQTVPNIVRLNPDSSMDADFNKRLLEYFGDNRSTIQNIEVMSDDRFRFGNFRKITEFHPNGEIAQEFDKHLDSIGPYPPGTWITTPEGKLLIGKSSIRRGPEGVTFASLHLLRLNADGSVDPSLDVKMPCDGFIIHMAAQFDGRILLGGNFSRIGNQRHHQLVRLEPDGRIDPSFVSSIEVPDNDRHQLGYIEFTHLTTLPDGDILVGGSFSRAGGMEVPGLARLNGGAGEPNAPWIGEGVSTSWTVEEGAHLFFSYQVYSPGDFSAQWSHNGVALPDGTDPLLQLNNVGLEQAGTYQLHVSNEWGEASGPEISLDVNPAPTQPGSIDYSFQDAEALDLEYGLWESVDPRNAVLSGDYLYVGGYFTHYGGHPTPWTARLFSDGRVDRSFVCLRDYTPPTGLSRAELLTVLHDQRALLNAHYRSDDPFMERDEKFLMLHPDGSLDRIFEIQGTAELAVETLEGNIILGGVLRLENVEPLARIARVDRNGVIDPDFTVFSSPTLNILDMKLLPDERLAALFIEGSIFTPGLPRYELRVFLADGTPDPNFQVESKIPTNSEHMAVDPQGRIYLSRDPYFPAPGRALVRILPDGGLDSGFNAELPDRNEIHGLAIEEDGTIFVHFGFETARLRPDGSRDRLFQAELENNSTQPIRKMLIDENGQLIFAGRIYDRRTGRSGIIRINGYDERRLRHARLTEEGFEATLRTRSGHRYLIESTSDLSSGAWQETANQIGDGAPHHLVFPVSENRFFRIRLEH